MLGPFRHHRMVEFADTDMAGIMHFSAFYRFMESAEHALIRSVGLSIFGLEDPHDSDSLISFPRVSSSCDFSKPARCEDELDIEVVIERLGKTSITYGFRFLLNEEPIATGRMTSVCCRMHRDQAPEPTALPGEVIVASQPFVASSDG